MEQNCGDFLLFISPFLFGQISQTLKSMLQPFHYSGTASFHKESSGVKERRIALIYFQVFALFLFFNAPYLFYLQLHTAN